MEALESKQEELAISEGTVIARGSHYSQKTLQAHRRGSALITLTLRER